MAIDYPPVFINNYLAEKIPNTLSDYFSSNIMKFFPTQPTSIDTFTEEFPDSADEPFAVYDRMFRMRRKPFPHIRTEQLLYYFYKTSGGIDALIETVQLVQDLLDNGDESAEDLNQWIYEKYNDVNYQGKPQTRTAEALTITHREILGGVATLTTEKSHGFKSGDRVVVSGITLPGPRISPLNGVYTLDATSFPALNKISYATTMPDALESTVSAGSTVGIAHPTINFGTVDEPKNFFLPYFHETKLYQLEEARDIIDFGTARTYAGNKMIIEYDWHKSSPL